MLDLVDQFRFLAVVLAVVVPLCAVLIRMDAPGIAVLSLLLFVLGLLSDAAPVALFALFALACGYWMFAHGNGRQDYTGTVLMSLLLGAVGVWSLRTVLWVLGM